jgi:hypothetical protein
MNKEFIPYQEALELKELGFDEPCLEAYDKNGIKYHSHKTDKLFTALNSNLSTQCSAPLFQQAFRWFREKYQLHSYIEGAYPWFRFYINSEDNRWEGHKHLSHEEAELECLKKLIQIVKNKGGDK